MRYANARYQSQRRDLAYRFYITDALSAIASNTSKLTHNGVLMSKRFYDVINPEPQIKQSGDEIAESVINQIVRCN